MGVNFLSTIPCTCQGTPCSNPGLCHEYLIYRKPERGCSKARSVKSRDSFLPLLFDTHRAAFFQRGYRSLFAETKCLAPATTGHRALLTPAPADRQVTRSAPQVLSLPPDTSEVYG